MKNGSVFDVHSHLCNRDADFDVRTHGISDKGHFILLDEINKLWFENCYISPT